MSLLRRLYNVARSNFASRPERSRPVDAGGERPQPPPEPQPHSAERPGDSVASGYYANLELSPGASFEEIKAAYRRLLRKYHPDRHHQTPSRSKTAEEISKRLNEAMDYFEKEHAKEHA